MEIIMQWLDDLEDVVFAVAQTLERLRWPCLKLGLMSSCALVAARFAELVGGWISALVWIGLASVGLWAAGMTARGLPRGLGAAPDASAGTNA